jgi:hypothetical protein
VFPSTVHATVVSRPSSEATARPPVFSSAKQLGHAGLDAGLAEERGLLVARDAGHRNAGRQP